MTTSMARDTLTIYHFPPGSIPPERAESYLTDSETSRAAAFRFPADAAHWSACRATLRQILGAWLGIPPRDVPIIISPSGKPLLAPPLDSIHFNLSHSRELALIAVNPHSPVGIDLEPLNRAPSLIGCESTFCHPEEIASLPTEEVARADELLRLWTAKEAYVKALGTGFSTPPETIRILTRHDGIFVAGSADGISLVRLQHPALNQHLAHLCSLQHGGPAEITGVSEMPSDAAPT
jgi:4'-phosphopantetheinyl transferase